MATTEAPLRVESTLLEEPEKQQLLPKSYSEAVEEELSVDERHAVDDTNGTNSTMNAKQANGTASVRRIDDTRAPAQRKEEEEEVRDNRPQFEKNGSKHEYTAAVRVPIPSCSLTESYFYRNLMVGRSSPETPPKRIEGQKERHREPRSLGLAV